MASYYYDQNGVLVFKFTDFSSTNIKSVEYVNNVLTISNYAGYYYNPTFANLPGMRLIFSDNVEKRVYFTSDMNSPAVATDQAEWLVSTSGNDTLGSKAGNDRLFGGQGDDTYQFVSGDGQDVVTDSKGSNTLQFMNANAADISIEGTTQGLKFNYSATDSVTVEGNIASYKFADNSTLTQTQFFAGKQIVWNGTDAADSLNGVSSNDTLKGGKGNDSLNGKEGDDSYVFAKGDGIDSISDFSGTNTIVLSDVKSTDVKFSFTQGTLNIQYSNDDVIQIANFLANNRNNFGIQFADGVTVSASDFDAYAGVQYWVRDLVASTNTATDFKYNFPTTMPAYVTGGNANGWVPANDSAKAYLLATFNQIAGYTGLTFTATDNITQSNVITFQANIQSDSSGYAYYPGGTTNGSDIYMNVDYMSDPIADWQHYVYPHELGHALGLRHSFEGPTKDMFSSAENSTRWTTMAYNIVSYSDGDFKAFDIAALQAMYGVNTTARTGNDVYGFDGTKGSLVWDGTGIDTIDASTATDKVNLSLQEGSWSYIGSSKGQYISVANQLAINLGTQIENAIGGIKDDVLTGNALDNRLDGGKGNDAISGGWGNDNLIGGAGDDVLSGGTGNDILNGNAGNDALTGGTGDDVYYINSALDQVIESADEGTDKVYASTHYTLAAHVEELSLSGTANLKGTGNALDNRITGNSANNIIDGGLGNDIMSGGYGNDTYDVDSVGDTVTEAAGRGYDTIYSSVSFNLTGEVEKIILTGSADLNSNGNIYANTLTGNAGSNILDGKDGNDVLDGGAGADTLIGGLGDDTYYVDNINDMVVEAANAGIDKIYSSVSYDLINRAVEVLELTGTDNINVTGNELNNALSGNRANNLLNGGAGDDLLQGNAGNDTFSGGTGSDTAVYQLLAALNPTGGNGRDSWTDFTVGHTSSNNQADKIDLHELLIGFSGEINLTALDSYLSISQSAGSSTLKIDRDGDGSQFASTALLTLANTSVNLATLLDNQQIIV